MDIKDVKTAELVKKYNFKFSKSLGQNFLIDDSVPRDIVAGAEVDSEDLVIEIGPGVGTLTAQLLKKAKKVVAIELDNDLIPILEQELGDNPNFTLIHNDALKVDFNEVIGEEKSVKLVANLPYYVTTPIIVKLLKDGYNFDNQWNWEVEPCNTAFAYFNDEKFIKEYTKASIEFMENAKVDDNRITNMVFAEQRIISMVADKMNLKIYEMETLDRLLSGKQKNYTHLWGYKRILNIDDTLRRQFCQKIIKRIIKDFPEYKSMLRNIQQISTKYNI